MREEGGRRTQEHLSIPVNGSRQGVTLIVAAVTGEGNAEGAAVIAFQDQGAAVDMAAPDGQSESPLEQENRPCVSS